MTATYDVCGEYQIRYQYDDSEEWPRECVQEILGYFVDGKEVSKEELEKDLGYDVMTQEQLQEELDGEVRERFSCRCRGDTCYC